MSNIQTVAISDCLVSKDPDAVIMTHALGSCVGLVIFDPETHVGGLLHYMLPDSTLDEQRARRNPYMFADTGIPLLFNRAFRAGARKERLQVTAIGGAQILDVNDSFHIGRRNLTSMRVILRNAGISSHNEDVGGTSPRTVRVELATGRIIVSFGRGQHEIVRVNTEGRLLNVL